MLINANPVIHETVPSSRNTYGLKSQGQKLANETGIEYDDSLTEDIDAEEIFDVLILFISTKKDLIRNINDPEHPLTLEQLNVARQDLVTVSHETKSILVRFTPTIPHCSMATLIGLCIRVRLLRSLPSRFKVDIIVTEGTHQSEMAVNKQLNDKERVAAALENRHLLEVVNQCLKTAIHVQ
ncbi:hypothetical protein BASA50_009514 [Batrachochytrium salamandrivorans]|uniref:MIP18 family-like domain-containing protein n=1 Tax=Batrachochytrium salamandrivorans TaxID=1357716 RepID=A0ABQ8F173_9FUNG|nr:hypothetical protein BASA62_009832 [Batrachochytrium salamandrivorans]KAH6585762.1 hypothetical protein BASA61_006745 [Batrachochytrium salamandrivorans]KAH6590254.1 hypothetical protein BASA50_009514 [Batrachochytrium salamandrivorans]KAH9275183.1 hypothetical protein BASA83_002410 [Batrachochytrium salamandrivorans]KAJ1345265.1 hypothetical protein BSLG_000779 [Batrachochytrium salamandrivorans]